MLAQQELLIVARLQVEGMGFFADSKCLELPSESSRPEEIYLELLSQVGRYFYLAEVQKFSQFLNFPIYGVNLVV